MEYSSGGDDDEGGDHAGDERTDEGIDFAKLDVFYVCSLVDDSGLLEENLPGSDGGADVGHDESEEGGAGHAESKTGAEKAATDGGPTLFDVACMHGPNGSGNVNEVKEAEEESDFFEGPVSAA